MGEERVMYEVVKQNQTTGEFETTTVRSLGRGRNKIEKGATEERTHTVVDIWQVIRVTEKEEAPVVEEEDAEEFTPFYGQV
jgi:hypothetical protein